MIHFILHNTPFCTHSLSPSLHQVRLPSWHGKLISVPRGGSHPSHLPSRRQKARLNKHLHLYVWLFFCFFFFFFPYIIAFILYCQPPITTARKTSIKIFNLFSHFFVGDTFHCCTIAPGSYHQPIQTHTHTHTHTPDEY